MGALDGVKILDLSSALAGPYCTMMLADMGAEVIKVEPPEGDVSRSWGPPFIEGESSYFLSINRNKKSIVINLKSEKGKEIVLKLAEKCDVFVENFRPGVTKRLGVDYETVKKVNPKIIYCSISGFGQEGPYRDYPAFDQILQGMGGLMSITGEPGRPPVKVGIPITDIAAGMFAAYGIVCALFYREKTGKGQYVDVSMLDSQVAWLTYQAGRYFATGEIPGPIGSGHPLIVPYQAFKTKDGYINIAAGNDNLFRSLCKVLGVEHLADDPRFNTNPKRVENREELVKILEEIFVQKTTSEWLELIRKAGVPCGPIYNVADVVNDPQVLFRKMVVEIDHPKSGRIKVTGVPVKLSESPGDVRLPPPMLGQHTVDILKFLGYSDEDISKLKDEGVVK
ncbi:CoA transferase [Candidatus Bathyarchaeota archaeon]|nr:MAG: CoA transferase [Candidatus Bathyarchaeota archaeon]